MQYNNKMWCFAKDRNNNECRNHATKDGRFCKLKNSPDYVEPIEKQNKTVEEIREHARIQKQEQRKRNSDILKNTDLNEKKVKTIEEIREYEKTRKQELRKRNAEKLIINNLDTDKDYEVDNITLQNILIQTSTKIPTSIVENKNKKTKEEIRENALIRKEERNNNIVEKYNNEEYKKAHSAQIAENRKNNKV